MTPNQAALRVFDLAGNRQQAEEFVIPNTFRFAGGLAVTDTRIYLASRGSLVVFDLSGNRQQAEEFNFGFNPSEIDVAGSRLYAVGGSTLRVFDLSGNRQMDEEFVVSGTYYGVSVEGNLIYLVEGSQPSSPQLLILDLQGDAQTTLPLYGRTEDINAAGVDAQSGRVYLAGQSRQLTVLNLQGVQLPEEEFSLGGQSIIAIEARI